MRPRARKRRDGPTVHDQSYKRLFSHPQTVEDLLRGFLRTEWVDNLDFSTLEKVANSFISDDLRERRSDVIWRVRWANEEGWFYFYLLLEFQSTSYHFMAVRLLTYVGLLLEEIIRKERLKAGDKLPVVLPLVLYNGQSPWRAPLDLGRLFIPVPRNLRRHLPRLSYLVLDENRLDLDRPELSGNRIASLFRIETCDTPEALPELTERLAALLPPGKEPELRRTFSIWLLSVLHRTFKGATIPETVDLEDAPMLEETLIRWRDEGLRNARRDGKVEGMRELLLRQLERRFGPLPETVRQRIEGITSARTLNRLADKVVTAGSLREMRLR